MINWRSNTSAGPVGPASRILLARLLAGLFWVACGSLGVTRAAGDETVLFRQAITRFPSTPTAEIILGGKKAIVALDTGCSSSVLDSSLESQARRLKKSTHITQADGSTREEPCYQAPPFTAQSLTIPEPEVIVIDLRPMSQLWGRPISGVLGINDLSRGIVSINYDTALFEVHTGPWRLNRADCVELPLIEPADIPKFSAQIAGQSVVLAIDSGSDGSISLPPAVFSALVAQGVIEKATVPGHYQTADGSTATSDRGWFTSGELMGRSLAGISVASATGTVGLEWLSAFNIEVDFRAHKFRFQQRPNAQPPASVRYMLGALLSYQDGRAQIDGLLPGGGAMENAGLALGDVIENLGGLDAAHLSMASIGDLVTAQAGTAIPISFQRKIDGQIVQAQLRLPPFISAWNYEGRDFFKTRDFSKETVPPLLSVPLPAVPSAPMATVEIAGRKVLAFLSTGSEYTSVDHSLKDLVTGEGTPMTMTTGEGQESQARLFALSDVLLQSLTISHAKVLLTSLDHVTQIFGNRVGMILGVPELGRGKLLLNHDEGTLSMHIGPWKLNQPDCQEGSLEDYLSLPTFRTTLGRHSMEFVLQTGDAGMIILTPTLFAALVQDGFIEASPNGRGNGWFRQGTLMGKSLVGVAVTSAPGLNGTSILGPQWLCGFNIEIDLQAHQWRYQLRPKAAPPLATHLMAGASFLFPGEGARIFQLLPGGNGAAEKAGLRAGDIIHVFDTLSGSQLDSVSVAEVITKNAGQSIHVEYTRAPDQTPISCTLALPPAISQWDFPGRDIFQQTSTPSH